MNYGNMKHFFPVAALILLVAACNSQEKLSSYSWENDLKGRIGCDFTCSEDEVRDYISNYIPNVTDSQMRRWENERSLECMTIDGEKWYFNQAGPNLFRINPACRAIKELLSTPGYSAVEKADMDNLPEIMRDALQSPSATAAPKRMRVTYTLTVRPDAVPEGKTVRCWLPFPRTDHPRQQNVKLISTQPLRHRLAPAGSTHSTVYMEQKAVKGQSTVFTETFEFTSYGEWHNLAEARILPYNTRSAVYREYTSERAPHMVFSPRLRHLADSLTSGTDNPYEKALRLFHWINDSFPWASAREYSTIENIPEYVLDNLHGDCGQVSLLFITLCRISGIPAHFQSGFMMHPDGWNLHDWAEIYFEGVGWVPVDQSFGVPSYARSEAERNFFLGGIDSWRLIVNADYGRPLCPKKKYPRSETVDFQRGEVEWEGGNLYFTMWDYDMKITYLDV